MYFREPGNILFELATNVPGFTIDEDYECLGEELMVSIQHEHFRIFLDINLVPIKLNRIRKENLND